MLYEIAFDTVYTVPPGADVYFRDYRDARDSWERIGSTPMGDAPVPDAQHAIKITKAGYEPIVATDDSVLAR